MFVLEIYQIFPYLTQFFCGFLVIFAGNLLNLSEFGVPSLKVLTRKGFGGDNGFQGKWLLPFPQHEKVEVKAMDDVLEDAFTITTGILNK